MIGMALNGDNDIVLENNQIKRLSEGDHVLQKVRSRLLLFQGEWFLDITSGVPYYQGILGKPVDIFFVESSLKSTIVQTEGVEELITFSLQFDRKTRIVQVEYKARTIYGVVSQPPLFLNSKAA